MRSPHADALARPHVVWFGESYDARLLERALAFEADVCLAVGTSAAVGVPAPPLVYGPYVRGNFLRLLQAVQRGLPFPFGRVRRNRRSLVYVGNLVDVIALCLEHDDVVGETYQVADTEVVSTADLIERMARALDRPARLLPVPVIWLHGLGRAMNRRPQIQRLTGSLELRCSGLRENLGWAAPFTMETGMRHTATWLQGRQVV